MTEEAGFLRAIHNNPADPVPRLVYADWLEERGDPRADYLRSELALQQEPTSRELRERLWKAWAAVDPMWLATFTQPRLLLANPSPYPQEWKSFGLGHYRACDGTYCTWPYDSIPALPVEELRGEFQWLPPPAQPPLSWEQMNISADDFVFDSAQNPASKQRLQEIAAELGRQGFHVPQPFLRFMTSDPLLSSVGSVTGCFFYVPQRAEPDPEGNNGKHLTFYWDSQGVLMWTLYLHPCGASCVLACWPDFFYPPEEAVYRVRAWFVAPSFEAFVYRVWIENQAWQVAHTDYLRSQGRPVATLTPALRAYLAHYEKASSPP